MARGEVEPSPAAKPEPAPARRTWTHHTRKDEPLPEFKSSGISSWFGNKKP